MTSLAIYVASLATGTACSCTAHAPCFMLIDVSVSLCSKYSMACCCHMQRHGGVHASCYVHSTQALPVQPRSHFNLHALFVSHGCLCTHVRPLLLQACSTTALALLAVLCHFYDAICVGRGGVKTVQYHAGSLSAPLTKARSTSCQQQCRSRSTSCTSETLLAWLGRARTPRAWRTSTKPSWQNLVARTPESWVAQVSPTTSPPPSLCALCWDFLWCVSVPLLSKCMCLLVVINSSKPCQLCTWSQVTCSNPC